ncbi:MAG TPA: hypothetical protein VHS58_11270, partial [Acetobacteraceae bacterium]|nr:hypothetical protein [Acetobacteraceae bacterium]
MLQKLADWLDENDPARVDIRRALELLVAITLACGACLLLEQVAWVSAGLPMLIVAGVNTLNMLFNLAPASRAAEQRQMLVLGMAGVLPIVIGAAIAPADRPYGEAAIKLLFVAVLAGGFYVRRYGPLASAAGTMTNVTMFLVSVLDPSKADGMWLVIGALIGAASAALVRLVPSHTGAPRAIRRYLERYRFDAAACVRSAFFDGDATRRARLLRRTGRSERAILNVLAAARAEVPELGEACAEREALAARVLLSLEHLAAIVEPYRGAH